MAGARRASRRQRELRITAEDRPALLLLTTTLALLLARPAPATSEPACDRRTLWRFGISGDRPLIVVTIGTVQGLRLVRSLAQALPWWSWGAMACDLVILNAEPRSYLMPLQAELLALAQQHGEVESRNCVLHLLFADEVSTAEMATFKTLARAYFRADGRPLSHSVQELAAWHDAALERRLEVDVTPLATPAWAPALAAAPGDFDTSSGAFRFGVDATRRPARPWVNVLANPDFGTQVSEAGAGYSWAGNSRLHALTPWSNDAVSRPGGRMVPVAGPARPRGVERRRWRRQLSGGVHGRARAGLDHDRASPRRARSARHLVCRRCALAQASAHRSAAARGTRAALTRHRRVRMAARRAARGPAVGIARPSRHSAGRRIGRIARVCCWHADDAHAGFGGSTAFFGLQCSKSLDAEMDDWTCDRRELFDARGRVSCPTTSASAQGPASTPAPPPRRR